MVQRKRKATESEEKPSPKVAKINSPIEPAREGMVYVMNPDCWLEIFEYLSIDTLLTFCKLSTENDEYFTGLVNRYHISHRLLTLDMSICYSSKMQCMLNTFGKSIKRLKLEVKASYLFQEAIQQIIKYCSPGTLEMIDIDLTSCGDIVFDWNQMQELIPFICNIKNLKIVCDDGDSPNEYGNLCSYFINGAKNLKTIKLVNINWGDTKFSQQIYIEETKLTELDLVNSGMFDSDFRFIEKLPHLEVFKCIRDFSDSVVHGIGEAVAKHCPKLRIYENMKSSEQAVVSAESDDESDDEFDELDEFDEFSDMSEEEILRISEILEELVDSLQSE
jgi:hypothetical protein